MLDVNFELISAVEQYMVLYDSGYAQSKNASTAQNAWCKVTSIVKLDAQECKNRWRNMSEKLPSVSGASSKVYKYNDALQF